MNARKLFQALVVGGAVLGAGAAVVPRAEAADKADKDKKPKGDAKADAGAPEADTGGGAKGW